MSAMTLDLRSPRRVSASFRKALHGRPSENCKLGGASLEALKAVSKMSKTRSKEWFFWRVRSRSSVQRSALSEATPGRTV